PAQGAGRGDDRRRRVRLPSRRASRRRGRSPSMKRRGRQAFSALVIGTVASAVGIGLWLLGSPAEERAARVDARRVDALSMIAAAVDVHWTRTSQLPAALAELERGGGPALNTLTDPVTGAPYEYRVTAPAERYELCAIFERASSDPDARTRG